MSGRKVQCAVRISNYSKGFLGVEVRTLSKACLCSDKFVLRGIAMLEQVKAKLQ